MDDKTRIFTHMTDTKVLSKRDFQAVSGPTNITTITC